MIFRRRTSRFISRYNAAVKELKPTKPEEGHTPKDIFIKIFSSNLLLTVLTGALFLCGYSYLSGFYSYFRIRINFINPDFHVVLAHGAINLFGPLFFLLVAVFLLFVLKAATKGKSQPLYTAFKINLSLIVSLFAIALFICVVILLLKADAYGRKHAAVFASTDAPFVKVDYSKSKEAASSLPMHCGMLCFASGKYYFFDIERRASGPAIHIIDEREILQISIIGTVKNYMLISCH